MNMQFSNIKTALEEGRLKIPQFQRDFVWTLEESAALLDSVIKDYPIGSIILWNTTETLRTVRNIGGLDFDTAKEGTSVNYIIDGQQRVTSLYAILKGVEEIDRDGKKTSYKNVYVDLETQEGERIVVLEKESEEDSYRYIRLHELLEFDPEFIRNYSKDRLDKIRSYRDKIISFELPKIDLPQNADIEVATEVFTRLNTGGKDLSPFEIMVAKTYSEKPSFDLSEKYKKLCEELGDWEIPDSTVLQIVSVLLTEQCSRKVILALKKDEFIAIWEDVVDSIKRAIDFFKKNYQIPVSKLLPYDGLTIPFAYYFFRKKNDKGKKVISPIGDDKKYLQDLFWRIALSGRYSSSVASKVAQDIGRVKKIIKGKKPSYDWPVDPSPESIKNNGEFSVGRSFIKAILAIYAAKKPRCFRTGGDVILDNSYLKIASSKNYHHFFPKGFLNKKNINIVEESFNDGEDKKEFYVNHILNITIIDAELNKGAIGARAPSDYLSRFQDEDPKLKEYLKTHLIDLDKDEVLEDNYKKFFDNRAKRVSAEIKKRIIEG